jgi:hypothetical protein
MTNEIKEKEIVKETIANDDKTYKCQICGKDTGNSVDAMTHYLDHGSSALEAVNSLIKDQKIGNVSTEGKQKAYADDRVVAQKAEDKIIVQKDKKIIAAQEVQ